ncbi:hypothetical protein JCM13580A_24560 [Streptomyces drozdowiczii]
MPCCIAILPHSTCRRRWPSGPHRHAPVPLLHLRKYETLAQIAATFGISVGTAHAYIASTTPP